MTLKLFKNFLHIERVKVLSIPLKGYYKASDVSRSYKSELVNTMYSESTYANRIYFPYYIQNEEQYIFEL